MLRAGLPWRVRSAVGAVALTVPTLLVGPVGHIPVQAAPQAAAITLVGTTSPNAAAAGSDARGPLEVDPAVRAEGPTPVDGAAQPNAPDAGAGPLGADHDTAAGTLLKSFNGLNLRQQRLANGGNQFTVEPPDQGLCASGRFVLESVNDVLRVFDTGGVPLTPVVDLNTFYGYPAAINRATGRFGPVLTDPTCVYDPDTQRFFHVVLTLDRVGTTSALAGSNHLDLAVSNSSDPTGTWTVYRIDVTNDGTNGTPNHGCRPSPGVKAPHPNACIGDYPHIGLDGHGVYVTTNEYELFGDGFISANIIALSKRQLAAAAAHPAAVVLETRGAVHSPTFGNQPGFTVWPAATPSGKWNRSHGGTEFFLSSNGADEAICPSTGATCNQPSSEVVVWALTNTRSLDSATPDLRLENTITRARPYFIADGARWAQKDGPAPLRDCLNDTACATFLIGAQGPHEVTYGLDGSDTRMQQVTYEDGKLYSALETALKIRGKTQAGFEWFIIEAAAEDDGVHATTVKAEYFGVPDNNVTYPAVGVNHEGRGVIAFTLFGRDEFPSAAYVTVSDEGTGPVHVAAAGLGPADGFTGYKAFVGNPPRTRWGDYGAAAVVGDRVWIASEYIGQTCTLAQYTAAPFGSCGGTRVALGNWYTRVSLVAIGED